MDGFVHEFIDHAEAYVSGPRSYEHNGELLEPVETCAEGYIYQRRTVPPSAYCDEQAFRYNYRCELNDAERFRIALPASSTSV